MATEIGLAQDKPAKKLLVATNTDQINISKPANSALTPTRVKALREKSLVGESPALCWYHRSREGSNSIREIKAASHSGSK